MTNTQRVDVERLRELLALDPPSVPEWNDELDKRHQLYLIEAGEFLRTNGPALLQQLAEREAEVEALRHAVERSIDAQRAAERAREEARTLLTKINRFGVLGLALEEEINAFLAASGGKDNV